jgi:putative transposase
MSILVDRLWRTVKYEGVYPHEYHTISETRQSLEAYFLFYNAERLRQGLGYHTPYEVYFDIQSVKKSAELENLNG